MQYQRISRGDDRAADGRQWTDGAAAFVLPVMRGFIAKIKGQNANGAKAYDLQPLIEKLGPYAQKRLALYPRAQAWSIIIDQEPHREPWRVASLRDSGFEQQRRRKRFWTKRSVALQF
jgi:hypothetical protein